MGKKKRIHPFPRKGEWPPQRRREVESPPRNVRAEMVAHIVSCGSCGTPTLLQIRRLNAQEEVFCHACLEQDPKFVEFNNQEYELQFLGINDFATLREFIDASLERYN